MKITHNTIFKKLTSKQTNIRDQIMSFLSYFLRETTNQDSCEMFVILSIDKINESLKCIMWVLILRDNGVDS